MRISRRTANQTAKREYAKSLPYGVAYEDGDWTVFDRRYRSTFRYNNGKVARANGDYVNPINAFWYYKNMKILHDKELFKSLEQLNQKLLSQIAA